jgi:hypothetical protein
MKLRPLQDRILVQRVEEETTTKGGIIIPDTAKEKPAEGKVIAVGKGKLGDDGKTCGAGSEKRRPDPVRQIFRHRGENRRRRIPDHA